jgi:hypothetical protein
MRLFIQKYIYNNLKRTSRKKKKIGDNFKTKTVNFKCNLHEIIYKENK